MFSIRRDRGGPLRAACALVIGVALAALAAAGPARGDEPKPPVNDKEKLQKLYQARLEAAEKAFQMRIKLYEAGGSDYGQVMAAANRVFTAELERLDKKEDRVAACEKNLERYTAAKRIAEAKTQAGLGGPVDVLEAECERLGAEIRLEKEKAK